MAAAMILFVALLGGHRSPITGHFGLTGHRGGHRNKGYTLFPRTSLSVKTLSTAPYPMEALNMSAAPHAVTTASSRMRRGQGRRLQDHHLGRCF